MATPDPARPERRIGLPDRATVLARARGLQERSASELTVIAIGIDRLGRINDAHGPRVGDEVVAEIADRLRDLVRDDDIIGRISGTEFLVITAVGADRGAEMARRLAEAGDPPIRLRGIDVSVTTTAGYTGCGPNDSVDHAAFNARDALHDARRLHLNASPFDADAQRRRADEALLRDELSTAVESGQLVLHIQPCVALATGRIHGGEALVRWLHPRLGLLEPAEFIAHAEDAGLIGAIDAWALEQACRHLGSWRDLVDLSLFHLSVNVSAKRFDDPNLERATVRAVERHQVPGRSLWIELTETEAMHDSAANLDSMAALRSLGVRFLLDDFGTGHSSLEYLQRFPIDGLKLDRTFTAGLTANPRDEAIVELILTLATSLELDVIAEGVETVAQRDWLREHGCELAQGELFSGPLDADGFRTLLAPP